MAIKGKLPAGKGYYVWQLYRLHSGDMVAFVEALKAAGINWVTVKLTDGAYEFQGAGVKNGASNQAAYLQQLVPLLEAAGIELHGWGYVYGYSYANCIAEAQIAAATLAKYPTVKSWAINAEKEFKVSDGKSWAKWHTQELKRLLAAAGINIPVALSSFRFPLTSHPEFPWFAFANWIDFWMPQVYWQADTRLDAGALQLEKDYGQVMSIKQLPYIPAGTTYPHGSWWATPRQLVGFMDKAKELGIPAVNYWAYYYATLNPVVYDAVAGYDWQVAQQPTEPEEPTEPTQPEQPGVDTAAVKAALVGVSQQLAAAQQALANIEKELL